MYVYIKASTIGADLSYLDRRVALVIIFIVIAVMAVPTCYVSFLIRDGLRTPRQRRQVLRKLNNVHHEYVTAAVPGHEPVTCPFCQAPLQRTRTQSVSSLSPAEPLLNGAAPVVRRLRCAHAFHGGCFTGELPATPWSILTCPVCGDSDCSESTPPTLSETRDQDADFRIQRLAAQHPEVLTEQVVEKLEAERPNLWPNPMTWSYLLAEGGDLGDGGSANGDGDDGQGYYEDIPSSPVSSIHDGHI